LFSEVPGFPPAHLPAAPGYGGGDGFRGNHFGGGFGGTPGNGHGDYGNRASGLRSGFGGYGGRDVQGH